MNPRSIFFSILVLFIISACQPAASTATQGPTQEVEEFAAELQSATSTTALATSTVTPTPAEEGDVAACKLQSIAGEAVSLGFPRPAYRQASTGDVHMVMLFVDFPDAEATRTPEAVLGLISPDAENLYKAVSGGRMNLTIQPSLTWLRMSQPSTHYAEAITTFNGHLAFIQEAVNLANGVDYSNVDSVVVISNPDASAIGYGPTFTGFGTDPSTSIQAGGRSIDNGITSGADLLLWGYKWLNHEDGHSMGLVDLYAFDTSNGQFPFTGPFSLMGDISGVAPQHLAFEMWNLGWLDDGNISCIPAFDPHFVENTTILSPIEMENGWSQFKAAIIPISSTKAVVMESRRAMGYDSGLGAENEGVLVYVVETSIGSGYGPVQAYPYPDPISVASLVKPGNTVTIENWVITVDSAVIEGVTYDSVNIKLSQ